MAKTTDILKKMTERKIGAHVSAAGGHYKALERAAEIGCNCVQLFSGSPRVWKKPELSTIDVDKIDSKRQELSVEPIFTHSLYLINLASDKAENVAKSSASLMYELEFDALIHGAGVVVHIGSHQGRGFDAVEEQLITTIIDILQKTPTHSKLLIENAASRNGKIGGDLSEIARLLNALEQRAGLVGSGRVGWCLDTCHAHAAGYVLGDAEGSAEGGISLKKAISQLDLWSSLGCVHVNDSKDPLGSNRDRHENIGEGTLPQDDLADFLRLPELTQIPLITEAPGFDGNGPDAENIKRLKQLAGVVEEK